MSEERIIYGICQANCREPVYSREEVLSILQQVIDAGSLQGIDISKSPIVALIRESRANNNISFWMGTEAQFNDISPAVNASFVMARIDENGKVYFCTDDTTLSNWKAATIELLEEQQAEALNAFEENVNTELNTFESNVNTAIAGKQDKHKTVSVSLTTSGWSSSKKTVSVSGVTASNVVIVAPAPASADVYNTAGIICTAQGAGTLTFTYKTAPTANMTVNVIILD